MACIRPWSSVQNRNWTPAAGASVTGKGKRSEPQWPWNGARFREHPKAVRSQSLASGLCWAEDEPSDGAGPYGSQRASHRGPSRLEGKRC